MLNLKSFVLHLAAAGLLAASASAGTVTYQILLDGQNLATATPANFTNPGHIRVDVQVKVAGNQQTWNGSSYNFGLGQGSFNLVDSTNHLAFEASGTRWNSTVPTGLQQLPGFLNKTVNGVTADVFDAVAYVHPSDRPTKFQAFGPNSFTTVCTGYVSWDGQNTTLQLNPRATGILAVSGSSIVQTTAATVTGASVQFSSVARVPGDIDGDGHTNLADLKLLVAAWNSTPTSGNWNANADLDKDNYVGLSDLKILIANWNR